MKRNSRPGLAPVPRRSRRRAARLLPLVSALCAAGLTGQAARADDGALGHGLSAVWALNATLSAGWRAGNPDRDLIGIGDGGSGSGYTAGPATQNFAAGHNYSTLLRLVGDVNLKKDNFGLMLRAKAWEDVRLKYQATPVGAPSNDYAVNQRLSDEGFDTRLSKFSGAQFLDAYAYGTFNVGDRSSMKVKLGSHAVNWGESLFIPGVNRYSVFDVSALRQPGTLIKEGILPVQQVSMNLGVNEGLSLEGFYQFEWKPHVLDGCGTYWSLATSLNCRKDAMLVASDAVATVPSSMAWNGIPTPGGLLNERVPRMPDRKPKNGGQFGLSMKKVVEALDAEIGAYYVNYTTHAPIISMYRTTDTIPGSVWNGLGASGWNYDATNIKVAGLSASTVLLGWSVSGEVSHTRDFPVQMSPVDAFYAFAQSVGPQAPLAGFAAAPPGSGAYIPSFDRHDFSQVQLSTLKVFSNVAGISSISFAGEVGYQHWNGIGDPFTSIRYGRGFEYGAAQHATFGGSCPAAATNVANCTQDGYFTSNAWGARGLVELEFPNVAAGINLKPRLFLSKDVKGWSADGTFSQGRHVVSLGLKAEYLRRYTVDVSYTTYNHKARFDPLHDRDFIGLALSAAY